MRTPAEQRFRRIVSGVERSATAALARLGLSIIEPFYAAAMRLRNAAYDAGVFRTRSLGRPTLSVGNITTGGTGKTPLVQWLARELAKAGEHPAILLRGYKSAGAGVSDEQQILQQSLADAPGGAAAVIANPDRAAGAAEAIGRDPRTSVLILDDAMQHRRAARDFELVLVHAGDPFGFDRIFPRGLLREPMRGLARADAVLITHASEAAAAQLRSLQATIRRHNSDAPIFRCDHVIHEFLDARGGAISWQELDHQPIYVFCGIGSPESFVNLLMRQSARIAGSAIFGDHHAYTMQDMSELERAAAASGASAMVTTEKDWSKVRRLLPAGDPPLPIWRASLALRFWDEDESALLSRIRESIRR